MLIKNIPGEKILFVSSTMHKVVRMIYDQRKKYNLIVLHNGRKE